MNKQFKSLGAIWLIALIAVNALFIIAGELGAHVWGMIFVDLTFILYIAVAYKAFQEEKLQKFFYNLPLLKIGKSSLVIITILGIASAFLPTVYSIVAAIACLLVAVFYGFAYIKANAAGEIVSEIDDKIKANTFFVKSLTVDAEVLLDGAKTDEGKNACKKVYEAVRYSDPMSNDALAGVESQITLKFNEFSNAVKGGSDNVGALADDLVILIGERNKKCKLLK